MGRAGWCSGRAAAEGEARHAEGQERQRRRLGHLRGVMVFQVVGGKAGLVAHLDVPDGHARDGVLALHVRADCDVGGREAAEGPVVGEDLDAVDEDAGRRGAVRPALDDDGDVVGLGAIGVQRVGVARGCHRGGVIRERGVVFARVLRHGGFQHAVLVVEVGPQVFVAPLHVRHAAESAEGDEPTVGCGAASFEGQREAHVDGARLAGGEATVVPGSDRRVVGFVGVFLGGRGPIDRGGGGDAGEDAGGEECEGEFAHVCSQWMGGVSENGDIIARSRRPGGENRKPAGVRAAVGGASGEGEGGGEVGVVEEAESGGVEAEEVADEGAEAGGVVLVVGEVEAGVDGEGAVDRRLRLADAVEHPGVVLGVEGGVVHGEGEVEGEAGPVLVDHAGGEARGGEDGGAAGFAGLAGGLRGGVGHGGDLAEAEVGPGGVVGVGRLAEGRDAPRAVAEVVGRQEGAHVEAVGGPEGLGEDDVGQADVVELDGVDLGDAGEAADVRGEVLADGGVGGAEEAVVADEGAVGLAEGGFSLLGDGVPVGVGVERGVVGAVERPHPGDGAQTGGLGPSRGLGDVGVRAADDDGVDAGLGPGAEAVGGEGGVVAVDPEAHEGREGLLRADGVGGEAHAAPMLGGVDGGQARGGPHAVRLLAGGGVVDAREVHAPEGAGGGGLAGARVVGVAEDRGPGPGDFDRPAGVVALAVVEGALEGDGRTQALDVPVVEGQGAGLAVGRGEEEVPHGAELVDLQLQVVPPRGGGVDEDLEVVVAVDHAVALGEGGAERLGRQPRGHVEEGVVIGHADLGRPRGGRAGEVAQGGEWPGLRPGGLVEAAVDRDGAEGALEHVGGGGAQGGAEEGEGEGARGAAEEGGRGHAGFLQGCGSDAPELVAHPREVAEERLREGARAQVVGIDEIGVALHLDGPAAGADVAPEGGRERVAGGAERARARPGERHMEMDAPAAAEDLRQALRVEIRETGHRGILLPPADLVHVDRVEEGAEIPLRGVGGELQRGGDLDPRHGDVRGDDRAQGVERILVLHREVAGVETEPHEVAVGRVPGRVLPQPLEEVDRRARRFQQAVRLRLQRQAHPQPREPLQLAQEERHRAQVLDHPVRHPLPAVIRHGHRRHR